MATPDQPKYWSKPLWLSRSSAKRVAITLDGVRRSLFVYTYRFHNVSFLEVFDSVPTLVLSPLQSLSIRLRHYDRLSYYNVVTTATDSDTASDASVSSLSSMLPSMSSGASSSSCSEFVVQARTDDRALAAHQIAYQSAYADVLNIQVVARIPSISVSVYEKDNGVYSELVHVKGDALLITLQRSGCELFSGSCYDR